MFWLYAMYGTFKHHASEEGDKICIIRLIKICMFFNMHNKHSMKRENADNKKIKTDIFFS